MEALADLKILAGTNGGMAAPSAPHSRMLNSWTGTQASRGVQRRMGRENERHMPRFSGPLAWMTRSEKMAMKATRISAPMVTMVAPDPAARTE
jgi:hypothetical protein